MKECCLWGNKGRCALSSGARVGRLDKDAASGLSVPPDFGTAGASGFGGIWISCGFDPELLAPCAREYAFPWEWDLPY